jgi:hypothetical protein
MAELEFEESFAEAKMKIDAIDPLMLVCHG